VFATTYNTLGVSIAFSVQGLRDIIQLHELKMQALSGLTEAVMPKKQPMTFGEKIQHYIKEFFEELVIYFLKFKAWLTPGTADDQVRFFMLLRNASSNWSEPVLSHENKWAFTGVSPGTVAWHAGGCNKHKILIMNLVLKEAGGCKVCQVPQAIFLPLLQAWLWLFEPAVGSLKLLTEGLPLK
jgi:hypothetical protein